MSDKIFLSSIFGYREDTLENWENHNPILVRGEPGIVSDGVDGRWLKIGDGKSTWKDLPWKLGPKGEKGEQGVQGEDGAGEITPDGSSVVFNDYENNVAGTKVFRILHGEPVDITEGQYVLGQYVLDSVEGLEIGMTFCLHLYDPADDGDNARYDDFGTITDIHGNTVSVSNYTAYSYGNNSQTEFHEKSYFRISGRPDLGTEWHEGYAFVGGTENKAIGRGSAVFGKGSIANDACALVGGRECYANYAGTASGFKNRAYGQRSNATVGENNRAFGGDSDVGGANSLSSKEAVAAFARGRCVRVNAPSQAAVGQWNKETSDAMFMVGIGTGDNDRRNGFVVYNDGSAEIAGKVFANGINLIDSVADALTPIIQVDTLPSKGKTNKIYCVPNEEKHFDKFLWLNFGEHPTNFDVKNAWSGSISAPSGEGTEESPYLISTAEELAFIVLNGGGGYYKLTNDIYLNNPSVIDWKTGKFNTGYTVNDIRSWYHSENTPNYVPMKDDTVIDGNGFVVYGLYKNGGDTTGGEDGCALIPRIASGATVTIKNLGIDNAYINITSQAGGFIAVAKGAKVSIENCFVGENVLLSGQYTGTFVAYGSSVIALADCYSLNGCGKYLVEETWALKYLNRCYVVGGAITKRAPTSATECYATTGDYGTVLMPDKMLGANALENMALGEEYQTTDGYPMLKVFAYGWERL